MAFPATRLRRLRSSAALRSLVRETELSPADFVLPLFVRPGKGQKRPISSMPGHFQYSVDEALKAAGEAMKLGIPGVIVFGIPDKKDAAASGAYAGNGIVQTAAKALKDKYPGLLLIADLCFCEYTDHGHCGVVKGSQVLNDPTLKLAGKTAVSQAKSGFDVIAPSGMMDGQVGAIRAALDGAGLSNTPILAYAAKYASAFYGPFREAAESPPSFGDRSGYQMDPANFREALREVALDVEEGADMVMVKPALPYLDVLKAVKERFNLPTAAYQVSGEFAMIKAAAAKGWIDERRTALETLTSIKRAGADFILTYYALEAAKWLDELTRRRADQKALFARARKSLVGGVNSPVRAFKSVGGTPVFVESGSGPFLFTADGRRLIDYCLSWGPLMFGHARRELVAAATAALKRGSTFGAATEAEVALAERIKKAFPSIELLRMTSSGTEADMSALRAARAFTQRDLVIKFSGCYHGHVDSLLVAAGSGATTLGVPDSAGVPSAMAATTIVVPFNDITAVETAFKKNKGRIAALIVEPIPANMGVVFPREGFLEALRRITSREKALLIFDEVITGFRVCYGGVQTLAGVKPDLTILGKIVGGGMPLAVYGGRKDVMSMIAPEGPAYQAGTLSGNPVAVAAGTAMLDLLRSENPYEKMEQLKDHLCEGFRQAAMAAGVPLTIQSAGSMFTPFFIEGPVTDYASALKADKAAYGRFFHAMLKRGVYLPPAQWEAAFVSYAHSDRELDATIKAAREAFLPSN